MVDDDASVRARIGAWLQARGFNVVEASDADGAVGLGAVHVMIVNLELPTAGATLWQRLRGKEAAAPFPLLFLAATKDTRALSVCVKPHTDFALWPCAEAELLARVDALVRRQQDRDETSVLQRSALYDVLRDETAQTLLQHHVSGLRVIGSGLAHEMNSPLAALLASLEFAASVKDGPDRQGSLDDAMLAAQRLAGVVKRTQLMGASMDAASTVNVKALVEEIAGGFTKEAAIIEVVGEDRDLVAVHSELWAMFNALLENAVEAVANKKDGRVVVTFAARPHVVDVTIDDNGRGIDDKDLPFVFDLFFTKKHRWSSIGLGLPIAQAAAHRQGGFVFVDGKGPLGGARVSVLLPQRQSTVVANAAGRAIRRGLWSGED